ncbi:OB-fold protein [Snodgrassella alvi]|uniref:tRNA_anti-like n=1 Tax=Snodgrassella alvi TaxID=1196083 RepID=A0A2N9Y0M9_9NEIS|nr:hypothetical protein [Snodgrassella alvi]PIT58326.1 hypothetical protein BHC49_01580 [Snodgrassella alvi]
MKNAVKWIVIIVVILIILGIVFGKNDTKPEINQSSSAPATSAPAASNVTAPATTTGNHTDVTENEEALIKVTSNELLKAYKANEVAANKKFKDKKLSISGTINSIEAGLGDEPYVVLKAGDEFEIDMPQAKLATSEADKAANLKKGQKINMICTGDSEFAGTPMLSDCIIQ